ncbi:MAG: hypothetical protein R3C24_05705 [Cyanobacteriota/Melainabacteria group bacterium]
MEECLAMAKRPVCRWADFLLSGKTSEPVLLAQFGPVFIERRYHQPWKPLTKLSRMPEQITLDEALKQLKVEVDDVKVNKLGELFGRSRISSLKNSSTKPWKAPPTPVCPSVACWS